MRNLCSVVLLFLCLSVCAIAEESRILMDSFINGQSVRLVFDTGAEGPVLFRQAAIRLNLSIKEPPSDVTVEPGKVKFSLTEECRFQLIEGGVESPLRFAVIDIPDYLSRDFDGVMGWGGLKHLMLEMDLSSRKLNFRETLSFDKSKWKCLDIRTDLNILVVKTSNEDTKQDLLLIDTGSPGGLTIKKELWQQVAGDTSNQNTTLSAIFTQGAGLVVDKERWLRKLAFGKLPLREIPVEMGLESHPALINEGVDGILGMWGLSCYTWIVDGPAGKIYFRDNDLKRVPEKYEYNRLGAVFVPEDIQKTNALIAHVIKDGAAYAAGIRDGDVLLRIGQLDVTKWRTDPNVMPLSRFLEKPAGTQLDLVLMRDNKKMEITVTLEEIFK